MNDYLTTVLIQIDDNSIMKKTEWEKIHRNFMKLGILWQYISAEDRDEMVIDEGEMIWHLLRDNKTGEVDYIGVNYVGLRLPDRY